MFFVFELLSISLYDAIRENEYNGLPLMMIRNIATQILKSLKFLSEHSIIHCDLKPENILLKERLNSEIKLIDLGSSCFCSDNMYAYIQSRFYRAPEIILGIPFTCEIDIWSLGCILFELHEGVPLFAGKDEAEQLSLMIETNGDLPIFMIAVDSYLNISKEKEKGSFLTRKEDSFIL